MRRSISGGETLLLVDDEPSAAEPLMYWLEEHGYSVSLCSTGFDALNFIDMEESIDAIVTEAELKLGPGGCEIARSARQHFPDAAILVMADSDSKLAGEKDAPYDQLVRKPVEPAALGRLLARPRRPRDHSAASASSASRSDC